MLIPARGKPAVVSCPLVSFRPPFFTQPQWAFPSDLFYSSFAPAPRRGFSYRYNSLGQETLSLRIMRLGALG